MSDPEHVLVMRALGLGDALTGVPALRGLRRRFPSARLTLAAPAGIGGWLRDLGLVDAVLPTSGLAPLPAPPFTGHLAVNLHGRGPQSHRALLTTGPEALLAFASEEAGTPGPPWMPDEHEVTRWCRLVNTGAPTTASAPPAAVPEDWCSPADLRLGDGEHDGPVVVHPGAASRSRRWPAERWRTVIRELRQDVVVTGTPAEADLCEAVAAGTPAKNLCGHLSLPELARTVADARLLVCGDTGVAHLGTAFGTPSLLLFGPVSPQQWGPAIDGDRHVVLWHGDEHAAGDPHGDDLDPALAAITAREVTEAAGRLLGP